MTPAVLMIELRDELYAIIREPAALFFSIAMPVGFFALFASMLADAPAGPVSVPTFMLATFGTFGVVGVALLNPGIGVAEDRERGWFRVKKASPVPVGATLTAKVLAGMPVALGVLTAMTVTSIALGAFDTDLVTWLRIAAILLVGSLPFALLGLAVGFKTSGRVAPAVLNAVFLPMSIASGLWFPLEQLPGFVQDLAPALPLYHLSELAVGVLVDAPVVDNLIALAITTVVAAALAAWAYGSSRAA